ncbi:hypothetical protein IC617_01585 [Neiella sp. HB171785]|uniref:Uncharacterized protein n=1 Tax=Neiella litorisoli TaxID=2771431 RepID=A0A8J6UL12_9GAMM|nr:hypothetical protein [Neiella litorisoli]MBD1388110.1 hypothetical protein [Neiella litorisoli]
MPSIIDMLEKLGQDASLQTPKAMQSAKADLAEQVRIQNQPMNVVVVVADEDNDDLTQASLEKAAGMKVGVPTNVIILPADDDEGGDEKESDDTPSNSKAA